MSEKNLWGKMPDFTKTRTPKSILQKQAAFLTKMSDGVLQGHVEMHKDETDTPFILIFEVIAPALENYKHRILVAKHGIDLYPLQLRDTVSSKVHNCKSESQFLDELENLLSSAQVRKIITGLLAQIHEAD